MTWWAGLAAIGVVVLVVLVDTQHLGPLGIIYRIRYADKIGHFLVFGLLSLFLNLAAFAKWPNVAHRALATRVSGVQAVLMALEELSQGLFPWRTVSVWDLLAGYLGVALFTVVALWSSRSKARPA